MGCGDFSSTFISRLPNWVDRRHNCHFGCCPLPILARRTPSERQAVRSEVHPLDQERNSGDGADNFPTRQTPYPRCMTLMFRPTRVSGREAFRNPQRVYSSDGSSRVDRVFTRRNLPSLPIPGMYSQPLLTLEQCPPASARTSAPFVLPPSPI